MKLWQLIEKGMRVVDNNQTYFQYFEYDDNDNLCGACPIGAAYLGTKSKPSRIVTTNQVIQALLKSNPEILKTKVNYCHRCGIRVHDITSFVLHLNDDHMYNIENIITSLKDIE